MPVEDPLRKGTVPGPWRRHACQEGFDLDASVWVSADQWDRLERPCRDALRPTVAQDRFRLTSEGQVVLQLRHPWSDGTAHLLFGPLELLERLAVLVPRPRVNLILYDGVLAPCAAWRTHVVTCDAWLDCPTPIVVANGGGGGRLKHPRWIRDALLAVCHESCTA